MWYDKFLEDNIALRYIDLNCNISDNFKYLDELSCNYPEEYSYKSKSFYNEHEKFVKENFVGTLAEINKELDKAKILDEADYKKARDNSNKFSSDLERIAQYLLADESSNLSEAKFDIIYNKAYEMSHSEGFMGIRNTFEELEDFYNELIKA